MRARGRPRRLHLALLVILGALLLGSYNSTRSPVWRTVLRTGSPGCGCGQPGAPGAPLQISARRLDLHSALTDSTEWQNVYDYVQPRTVLPLGTTVGMDLRHIYPFAKINGADAGISLSQAADQGVYDVSWSGDATSLLIAFQMPTRSDGAFWDFSDRGGRITPDLEELEAHLTNPPYGKFLEFGWRATLNRLGAVDKFGPDTPLALAGLTASPLCKDFAGNVVSYPFGRLNYGDLAPDYYHTIADPYGYFRQYDYGSCSAFLPLHNFVRQGLGNAAITQHVPGSFPVGTLDITTTSARLLVASVLRGDTLQGPDLARHPVLRSAGPDELQADLDASGHVDTTVFGGHVTCPFHATWKVKIRIDGDPTRPYYNRIRFAPSEINGDPQISLGNCDGFSWANSLLDALVIDSTLDIKSYQKIAEGVAAGSADTVSANLLGQLQSDVYAANEALTPPLPQHDLLFPFGDLGQDAFAQELRTHRATSTVLLSSAPGPGGSCISTNLQYLDSSMCAFQKDATLRFLEGQSETATLGHALHRLMRSDPSMFTCAPIRGPGGYTGNLDSLASKAPYTDATGRRVSLANRIGECANPDDVPRLFVSGDTVFQACLNPNASNPRCRRCAKTQDSGPNCDFWKLLAADNGLPGFLSPFKCLHPVKPQATRVYPQVLCRGTRRRCIPRFRPTAFGNEASAMCVPIEPACAPCYDMLDAGFAVEDPDDRQACLDAPAYCRVPRGQVNPQSCDARSFAPLIDRRLIRIPIPYRCRLQLPLERVDLQPDGYRVVLSQGFVCPDGANCQPCPPGQACNVGALKEDQLKYLVWDRLTGLLGGDLGLQDIQAPGCYPERDEFGRNPRRPLTGTSALMGQLQNGTTLINPAGCGWQ